MTRLDLSAVALRLLGSRVDLDDLVSFNTSLLKDGATCFVTSVRDFFVWVLNSDAVPDGVNVLQPVAGPGLWFRQGQLWATQSDWYVDAIDGSNSNSGAAPDQALQTMEELTRRIGTLTLYEPVTVHVLSDIPEADSFVFRGVVRDESYLRIIGEATTELHAPMVMTAVTNFVVGTTRPSITVAGIDFVALGLIGKRCRITATVGTAAIDTIFWIEQVGGAVDTVFISRPYLFTALGSLTGTSQTLTVGDTFVVEELTEIGKISMRWLSDGTARVLAQQVIIESARVAGGVNSTLIICNADGSTSALPKALMLGCEIATSFGLFNGLTLSVCRYTGQADSSAFAEGTAQLRACSVMCTGSFQVRGYSEFFISQDCSFQATRLILNSIQSQAERSTVNVTQGISFWNWTGGGAFDVRWGSQLLLSTALAWGTSTVANTFGFRVGSGAFAQYLTTKPTVSGTLAPAQDVLLGGTVLAYAAIPAVNATNLASLVAAVQ